MIRVSIKPGAVQFADLASILNLVLLVFSGLGVGFLRSAGSWLPGPFLFVSMLLLQTVVTYASWTLIERLMPGLEPAGRFLAVFAICGLAGFICAFDTILFYQMIGYQPDKPAGEHLASIVVLFFVGAVVAGGGPWLVMPGLRNPDDREMGLVLGLWFAFTFVASLMLWGTWLAMGS